ncbi:MAG: hypothetical protein LBM27_04520 [Lactobacillaceae bacterium]|jgi:type VII secretion protein EssB|nr:hypothetical protein [Lactobacillaceae bacterium]
MTELNFSNFPIQLNSIGDDDSRFVFSIAKAEIDTDRLREILELLNLDSSLKDVEIKSNENTVDFVYILNSQSKTLSATNISNLDNSQKLILVSNLVSLYKKIDEQPVLVADFEPDNILITPSLNVDILHLGVFDLMPPKIQDSTESFREFKNLILSILSSGNIQTNYKRISNAPFNSHNDFLNEMNSAQNVDGIETLVINESNKLSLIDRRTKTKITKTHLNLLRVFLAILAIVSIGSASYALYLSSQNAKNNLVIKATNDYIINDFQGAISTLKKQNPKSLSVRTQFILAVSSIKLEDLNNDQKGNILNNLSVKSPQNVLLFWISSGRGDLTKALSYAKNVNDPQLILFAYNKLYDKTYADQDMDGQVKQTKLEEYQKQITKYVNLINGKTDSNGGN